MVLLNILNIYCIRIIIRVNLSRRRHLFSSFFFPFLMFPQSSQMDGSFRHLWALLLRLLDPSQDINTSSRGCGHHCRLPSRIHLFIFSLEHTTFFRSLHNNASMQNVNNAITQSWTMFLLSFAFCATNTSSNF